MNAYTAWLKTVWTTILSWFGVEEQKFASFLYPIFQDAKQLVEKDLLSDIIDGIPTIVTALTTGGIPAAITAATAFILSTVEKQGVTLAETTVNTLSNALVAQAQAALSAAVPEPVPVPVPAPEPAPAS
jgi:hypothetical protein